MREELEDIIKNNQSKFNTAAIIPPLGEPKGAAGEKEQEATLSQNVELPVRPPLLKEERR